MEQLGIYSERYNGVMITVEPFKQGWTVSWWEGDVPYQSVAWRTREAALRHARKQIDRYNRPVSVGR